MNKLLEKSLIISAALFPVVGPLNMVYADNQALTGGQSGVSVGQENGAETDSGHIANNVGTSHEGIGFVANGLTLNRVPNFDFGTGHTVFGGQFFSLYESGLPAGINPTITLKRTEPRDLIVTNADDVSVSPPWQVGLSFGQLSSSATNMSTTNPPTLFFGKNSSLASNGVSTEDPNMYTGEFDNDANHTYPYFTNAQLSSGTNGSSADNGIYGAQPTFSNAGVSMGEGQTIWSGTGVRSWALDFRDINTATLEVPYQSQTAGTFTGTLTWNLSTGIS